MTGGHISDFSSGSRGRRKGLVIRSKEIAQCIPERLHEIGFTIPLNSVRVESRELARANENFVVRQRQLKPLRIEPQEIEAGVAAGIRDCAEVEAEISTGLPHGRDVNFESLD